MERETTRRVSFDFGSRYGRHGRSDWAGESAVGNPFSPRYGLDVVLMCVGTGIGGFGLGLAFAMLMFVLNA